MLGIDWCMFGFHRYRNWKVDQEGKLIDEGTVVGSYRVLQATCKNCGKLKYKKIIL